MKLIKTRSIIASICGSTILLFAFAMSVEKKGYDKQNLDTSADPCQDFYTYAIGGWQKNNPIPSTESRWGAFNILAKQNEDRITHILTDLQNSKQKFAKGTPEQQVRDYYSSALDSASRNANGMKPIQVQLNALEACKSHQELMDLLAIWQQDGIGKFFGFYVSTDAKNSDQNVLHLSQSGLHLPDVDYYLKEDSANTAIRAAYLEHLTTMLGYTKMNRDANREEAKSILMLEKEIAAISMTRTQRRDPDKTYNKFTKKKFLEAFPGLDWKRYFEKSEMPEWDEVIVGQTEFLSKAIELWNDRPLEVWKSYFRWELTSEHAGVLSLDLEADQFAFYSGVLRDVKEMKPFDERAMKKVNGNLGELVGALFVKKHFSEASKKQVSLMVEEIREVFRERIAKLDWMSDTTKEKALEKLNAFKYKIGYPDEWKDYSSVEIKPNALFANEQALGRFRYKLMMDKLGKPVDRKEWGMTPQTVNAYYSSSKNEIVFPAGILQPPFFDPEAEDALNYGGIGAVIGHEFSHGFDDKGSKFDALGNLNNWWTEGDQVRFTERTNKIVEQFNGYEVLPGVHINGSMTQGENIADLAGLTLAFYALEKHYGANSPKGKGKDGFTWQQRFFLGWSLVWAQNMKEQELRNRILTDPHSPGRYRVIGPLSNLEEFWNAFDCKEGNPMVDKKPETRVVIW